MTAQIPETPWSKTIFDLLSDFAITAEDGLSTGDLESRRKNFGHNAPREATSRSIWLILVDQFKSIVIGLLAAAALVSFLIEQGLKITRIVKV